MHAGVSATIFTFQNKCRNTIWPGIQPGAGKEILRNGGFRLKFGENVSINAPVGWSGRFWGRHGCSFDQTGRGSCLTGDCGGLLACSGAGGAPPVSLAEFTLDSPDDYYDISLVDGYNVPISILISGGKGICKSLKCTLNLNRNCPRSLQVRYKKRVVACKSACLAFNSPEYCCTGAYANPSTCKPTNYSEIFKEACPDAYSYAYDDATSIVTCKGANYLIRFC
ncbi:Thaumatin [Macleaya cordata]|uniref:Thaumatin n=1 Tax=Macleaya cordata TaxID=56857 RepID=A0A200QL58_MACCD|nr:Thaumatin [Macleaya cordata]